jgi:hypothetical protein
MASPRFSRRTIIVAIEELEGLSQAQFTRLLLKLGADFSRWVPGESSSVAKRANALIGVYDQWPDRQVDGGEFLSDVLVAAAAARVRDEVYSFAEDRPALHPLAVALARDGYTVSGGQALPTVPEPFTPARADDALSGLLAKHSFTVPLGHLTQGLDAHSRGDWAASNAQVRVFLESLLDELAVRVDPAAAAIPSGHPRRSKLAAAGFFFREFNEWDDDGRGYVNGLFRRLHPHGAHPGLSSEEDSTFRLQTVVLVARLLLLRFERGRL